MAHTTNTISAPVRLEQDVWPVLGVSGGLGYVIANANINQWNRYKPFRNSAKSFATSGQTSGDRWDAMVSCKFGMNITEYKGISGLNSMITAAKTLGNGGLAWTYEKPRGNSYGNGEPFRMLDLNGYKNGLNPILEATIDPLVMYRIDRWRQFKNITQIQSQPHSITLSDMGWGNYYYGIAYRKTTSTSSSDVKCKTASFEEYIALTMENSTLYDAALFLSPKQLGSRDDVVSTDSFYMFPYPYLQIGLQSSWGIKPRFEGRFTSASLSGAMRMLNLGGSRTISAVRLCNRYNTHYSINSDGTYTITQNASGVVSENECDYSFLNGGSIEYGASDNWQGVPYPELQTQINLPILSNDNCKLFFQFTLQHASGGTTQYTFECPLLDPELI